MYNRHCRPSLCAIDLVVPVSTERASIADPNKGISTNNEI